MSRSLKSFAGTFAFHPRCKTIKLTHLCFADDLMIFCKGDLSSVRIICDCIQGFSNTSGLHANSGKLAIYLAGVDSFIKEDLRSTSQFTLGTLPFKYLGVPLSSKRFSIADCEKLADMMIKRISSWQAKHLSYAARLQLINSVLMGISSYWCQISILPKRVINIGNFICRSFLWFGVSYSHKPGNISWKEVCTPKKESLWVRWVHGVYTKGGRWEIFNAPATASWIIKKLCAGGSWHTLTTQHKIHWRHLVWNMISIPKTRFLCWLVAGHRLKTKEKLYQLGVVVDDVCPLCGLYPETHNHLFFNCPFSRSCVEAVKLCIGITLKPIARMDFQKRSIPKTKQHVFSSP
ncbi:uncharacterized protein LOC130823450 [Amaranthus tricolor]|uniref:uncharacterized protein LOC130823450 n=1 Tax=Amaranthus tricolor TaxID=29722 RepID=UPI002590911C|nr:uncharacterized protein LOC130823450 [Amaranthus tricolor]